MVVHDSYVLGVCTSISYGQKKRLIHHAKQWYSTLIEFRTGRAVILGGFVDCPPVQSETRIEAGTLRKGRQTQGSAPMYPPSPGATSSPHVPRFVSAGRRRKRARRIRPLCTKRCGPRLSRKVKGHATTTTAPRSSVSAPRALGREIPPSRIPSSRTAAAPYAASR